MRNLSSYSSPRKGFINEFNARHRLLSRLIFLLLFFALFIFIAWDGFIIGWDHPRLNDFIIDRLLISLPCLLAGLYQAKKTGRNQLLLAQG